MIPCPRTFDGKETYIDDNGVTIYRWYRPEWRGNYTLTIKKWVKDGGYFGRC